MNYKNFISVNIIASLGYFITIVCILEFIPVKLYPHLSLIELGYLLSAIYLLIFIGVLMFVIEFFINKRFVLKYIQHNVFKNSLIHNFFISSGLILSFLFFAINTYLILNFL